MNRIIPLLRALREAELTGLRVMREDWTAPEPSDVRRVMMFAGTGVPGALLRLMLWPLAVGELRATMIEAERRGLIDRKPIRSWPFPARLNLLLADGRGVFIGAIEQHDGRVLRLCVGTPDTRGSGALTNAAEVADWYSTTAGAGHSFYGIRAAGLELLDNLPVSRASNLADIPSGFACACTLNMDHGIAQSALSRAATAGKVETRFEANGSRFKCPRCGTPRTTVYHAQQAISHCSPKRTRRKR